MNSDLEAALQRGPQPSVALQKQLGVSQPTLSRLLDRYRVNIATLGKARATRYALYRQIRDLAPDLPVHRVSRSGEAERIGTLLTIVPERYWYDDIEHLKASAEHRSIPWFATDMRPQGYLGRFFPKMHEDLGLPDRVTDWSEDQSLYAIARRGEDVVGNLLIGTESLARWLARRGEPAWIPSTHRLNHYRRLANEAVAGGIPGSSAGGEHPKFTALIGNSLADAHHTIVKFSTSPRWSDLLLAEHLASVTLRASNHPSAVTEFFQDETRSYLEVVRFDRVGLRGRLGLVSLGAMDDQFVGDRRGWSESASALLRARLIDEPDAREMRFLSAFGSLIANTDMHFGNISFLTEGYMSFRLAPAYDMLPMLYAPLQDEVPTRDFVPPNPRPGHADQWLAALPVAQDFWQRLSRDHRASEEFRAIGSENAERIAKLVG
jgi:hypothetical protein